MRRKFLLILFGGLALVQLRTLKVTQIWMYFVPLIPLAFGIGLIFQDIQRYRQKKHAQRNLPKDPDD